MIFDTHAHYDDDSFDADRDTLLQEMHNAGVGRILDPGCDIVSTEKAMKIAEQYGFVYFAAGIHPENLKDYEESKLEEIRFCAMHSKCAAIGEIGLDYYWDKSNAELQKKVFETQLTLAEELNLPVIIHDREAHRDSLEIVSRHSNVRGVFHCYSGSLEMAEILLNKGWYLGFDGPVTYKNARKALEVVAYCPFDRILIETDSPYMSPVPNRGKRNNSLNLKYVIDKIAEIKKESTHLIEDITYSNACSLFNIE